MTHAMRLVRQVRAYLGNRVQTGDRGASPSMSANRADDARKTVEKGV